MSLMMTYVSCSLFINLDQIEAEAKDAYYTGNNEEALELYKSLIDKQSSRNE